jgi:hypothetical protein
VREDTRKIVLDWGRCHILLDDLGITAKPESLELRLVELVRVLVRGINRQTQERGQKAAEGAK